MPYRPRASRLRNLRLLSALTWLCVLTMPRAASAQYAFSDKTLFSDNSLSIWNSGPGFSFDTGARFLGTSWDLGKTIGGIDEVCVPLLGCAKAGAEVGASTSGKAGIGYGVKVDSGTFGVQYPAQSTFSLTPGAYHNEGMFSFIDSVKIGSSFAGLPAGLSTPGTGGPLRTPTLQVAGPTVQAYADLAAEFHGFAGATVCVGVCYGPAIGPIDINNSQELAAINRNGDGQIRVLGSTIVNANQSVSALGGLVNASFNLPSLDSSSKQTPGGFDGLTLTSTRRSNVAAINANLAQIAADAVGLTIPLSGNLGPFGYNLLQANAGATLDVQQTLKFTPKATGSYLFSAPVIPTINGVDGAATTRINFNFGDDVTFRPGELADISFVPSISLDAVVNNETDLVVGGDVNVKALGVDIAGLSLGPLVDQDVGSDQVGTIPIIDQTFTDHIGGETLAPISIDFAGCRTAIGGGEFYYPALCATSTDKPDGVVLDPLTGTFQNQYQTVNCDAYFPPPGAPANCTYGTPFTTGPYLVGADGPVFVNDPSGGPFIPTTPGASTTDGDATKALVGLGYTGPPIGDAPPFDIPEGAPLSSFTVPEPGSLALLACAAAALAAGRRRRPVRSAGRP